MSKTTSVRMDGDSYEFLDEITKQERSDMSKTVRDLVTRGRILLAVERYKKGEASLGKAAALTEYGGESRQEKAGYLQGLKNLQRVWRPFIGSALAVSVYFAVRRGLISSGIGPLFASGDINSSQLNWASRRGGYSRILSGRLGPMRGPLITTQVGGYPSFHVEVVRSEGPDDDIHSVAGLHHSGRVRESHPVSHARLWRGALAQFSDLVHLRDHQLDPSLSVEQLGLRPLVVEGCGFLGVQHPIVESNERARLHRLYTELANAPNPLVVLFRSAREEIHLRALPNGCWPPGRLTRLCRSDSLGRRWRQFAGLLR